MSKSDFGKVKLTTYESQFQYPLAAGLLLLAIEGFLLAAKPSRRIRRTAPALIPLLATIVLLTSCRNRTIEQNNPLLGAANTLFATADSLNPDHQPYNLPERADSLYHQALRIYQTIPDSLPKFAHQALFNQIAANYRIGNYDSIPRLTDSLLQFDNGKTFTANTHYNTGNSHLANGQYLMELANYEANDSLKQLAYNEYQKAIECYKNCLRLHPSDMDAKYNLMYAKKLLPKGGGGQGQGQGQSGQDQQNQQQNQQQGGSGQDQQQQRKEEQQQMNQSGDQEQKKDPQQGEGQGDQQEKKDQQEKEGSQPQPKKTEDQKALERQLNALKQNEKDIQKEREKMMVPVPRQSMEKDW
jgi:hypothetical protein